MPLPIPIGRQRDVLHLPPEGHFAVLGTAGSGKTTLAILRAAYLGDPATAHAGKTLLLTFNKALVTYLKHLAAPVLPNVRIENYHLFARGFLKSCGKMSFNSICENETRSLLIKAALHEVNSSGKNCIASTRPEVFYSDAIRWTYQLGYQSNDDVIAALQSGIYTLSAEEAAYVGQVRSAYERLRAKAGYEYDWDDVAIATYNECLANTIPKRYSHIVIDEGQDFSPIMIRSLTHAVLPNGSVTFFGDVAQQIYGSRFSWRSAGLQIEKPWLFEENYRNTKQIADLAIALTKKPFYKGVLDLVTPRAPRAAGPLPALVNCTNTGREIEFILSAARAAARTGTAAILLRDRQEEKLFTTRLSEKHFTRLHRDLNVWNSENGLYIGTYHSAKGLEFDAVYLPFLSTSRIPDPEEITAYGEASVEADEAKLIYVGITRARNTLILSYSGECSSVLPTDEPLYQRSTV